MNIDWHGSVVKTAELDISVVRAGKGPPVVFLHGWPEFKRTWLHNLPDLAAQFDCIAPDLRGFGATRSRVERPADGTPPQLLAKDLRDLADALGLERFSIVSHDVGSFVAQNFALAWPERVEKLFFFNCAYPGIGQRWGDYRHFPETWYQQFHQKDFAAALDTRGLPDPDFIIRTSGELRLSGFMLWQSAYSEYYFCDALWPAFRRIDFLRAIRSYGHRQRRRGR